MRRRLPVDWTERYNITPVLIETFVETPRYTGGGFRDSGWIYVGTTQGRGRYDRDRLYDRPRKDVWVRFSEGIGSAPSIARIPASGIGYARKYANRRMTFSTARTNDYPESGSKMDISCQPVIVRLPSDGGRCWGCLHLLHHM